MLNNKCRLVPCEMHQFSVSRNKFIKMSENIQKLCFRICRNALLCIAHFGMNFVFSPFIIFFDLEEKRDAYSTDKRPMLWPDISRYY